MTLTKEHREVGDTVQPQGPAQISALIQSHIPFAKRPVVVAYQAENGQ